MATTGSEESQQTVRFGTVTQEIDPESSLHHVRELTDAGKECPQPLSPEAQEEIRTLSANLSKCRCQARRLENFSFEPVSLPASRAPSPSPSISPAHRIPSGRSSPRIRHPSSPAMHSPPLTPAGTTSNDGKTVPGIEQKRHGDPAMMTPQISPPHDEPPTSMDGVHNEQKPDSPAFPHSPGDSPMPSPRPGSESDIPGVVSAHPKHPPTFTVGPTGDSLPPSRDVSPSRIPGIRTPANHSPGTTTPTYTPTYSRPFTPSGEKDDPYARSKRPPQPKNLDALEARFIFGGREGRRSGTYGSSSSASRSKGYVSDSGKDEKKHSFGSSKSVRPADESDGRSLLGKQHHHSSMSELKRFFKLGNHKHSKDKEKRNQSPAPSSKSVKNYKPQKSGAMTPPVSHASSSVPFADDHGLEQKYGRFGRVLGSGAGGSVRLMKRSSDGVTFAVKQFRARHSYESEKEYNKKVTAEFCIGSTLHHGNIIETMDLVREKGNYYVVMEYAPFDLFAIVMTGKMSREEISCATLQILSGVTYLHSMGLAHRDLKLDNVVVNEHGIMKIIDFGSAAVFRYPFENEIVLASGIVGSDPYLAPEVYDLAKYDPQPTDIWSLAIIFCCMTLRRFPWKAPRISDNSYKLFVSPPNDGPGVTKPAPTQPSKDSDEAAAGSSGHRDGTAPHSEPASRHISDPGTPHQKDGEHHRPASHERPSNANATASSQTKDPPQVIKGPWRLMRLLPRESRHIIGRMLEIDPKKRATMEEILEDKWVKYSQVCAQDAAGVVFRGNNHEHTLEPGSGGGGSQPATKQQQK